MPPTQDLAGGRTLLGTSDLEQLLAGEAKLVTDWANVTTDGTTSYGKFEVIALASDGTIAKYNPAGSAPLNSPVGILAQPIAINQTTKVPYYSGGFFNHQALIWPGTLTTLVARKAVFLRTPIEIGELSN